jgi:hypothetical protein
MMFDTDLDKIGISLHNVTKSRYMLGPPYVQRATPPGPGPIPGGDGGTDLYVTLIIVICVLVVLIALILCKIYWQFIFLMYSWSNWLPNVLLLDGQGIGDWQ